MKASHADQPNVLFGALDRRGYLRGVITGVSGRLLRRLALVRSGYIGF